MTRSLDGRKGLTVSTTDSVTALQAIKPSSEAATVRFAISGEFVAFGKLYLRGLFSEQGSLRFMHTSHLCLRGRRLTALRPILRS